MNFSATAVLEAFIISLSLSFDAFIASFAYGSEKIKIPMLSVQIINIVCGGIFGASFIVGNLIKDYLPVWFASAVCFIILFIIGITKLLDSVTKSIIKKYAAFNKQIKFSLFNFKFILNLYANPVDADVDCSKTISPGEALSLAAAMSLDGLAVGIGLAFGDINGLAAVILSLAITPLAIIFGCSLGNKAAANMPFNISWIGGVLLIALAFLKIL